MILLLDTDDGLRPLGPEPADAPAGPTVAVIPGADVALHRLILAEPDGAARLAEARMRATDLSAQPIEEVHVAVGPADSEGASWVALIDRQRMADHLARLRDAGTDPSHVVPAALLLAPPDGPPSMARFGDRVLLRTDQLAGLVEPSLASALTGASQLGRFLQLGEFAPGDAPDPLPLDLLQGEFAPRIRWWTNRRFQLLLGGLVLLLVALLVAPVAIQRARTAVAVSAQDAAVVALATQALGTRPADADAAATALANARRAAEGAALGARLSFVSRAIESAPGARLDSARLQPDGSLLLGLGGEADAVNAVAPKLASGAFATRAQGTTLVVGDRVAARAVAQTPLADATLRLVTARQDAALAAAGKARPPLTAAAVHQALVAAGLADPALSPVGGVVSVPAARATALLPAIADLELKGARFTALTIVRNADQTLSATLGVAP
jgi:general secretion pathway protein L